MLTAARGKPADSMRLQAGAAKRHRLRRARELADESKEKKRKQDADRAYDGEGGVGFHDVVFFMGPM